MWPRASLCLWALDYNPLMTMALPLSPISLWGSEHGVVTVMADLCLLLLLCGLSKSLYLSEAQSLHL